MLSKEELPPLQKKQNKTQQKTTQKKTPQPIKGSVYSLLTLEVIHQTGSLLESLHPLTRMPPVGMTGNAPLTTSHHLKAGSTQCKTTTVGKATLQSQLQPAQSHSSFFTSKVLPRQRRSEDKNTSEVGSKVSLRLSHALHSLVKHTLPIWKPALTHWKSHGRLVYCSFLYAGVWLASRKTWNTEIQNLIKELGTILFPWNPI